MKKMKCLLIIMLLLSGCSQQVSKEDDEFEINEVIENKNDSILMEIPVIPEIIDSSRTEFSSVMKMSGEGIHYSRTVENGVHTMSIHDWTNQENSVMLSCYGVSMKKDQTFEVAFDISSDIASSVTIVLSSYDEIYHEKTYPVDQGKIKDRFSINKSDFYDGKLTIKMNKSSEKTQGTIVLGQLQVSSSGSVKINQEGYLPNADKIAVFTYNAGDTFEVIDVNTNESVYQGEIVGYVDDSSTLEKNAIGDFSSLNKEGTYKIVTNFNHQSSHFEIKENIYSQLLNDALIALSSQRCGVHLTESVFGHLAHEACHTSLADVEVNDLMIDVSGGWHDAGDYGRYICPGVKAVSDLLLAYLLYPEAYGDDMGIMESGNGISDILDEARVELEWLLKMQREDTNAFYNSVITEVFAGMISPEEDTMQLYVLKQENTATAAASAALAFGSMAFKEIDEEFSNQCLDAAIRGFNHAQWQRGSEDIHNPENFSGGDYANGSDYDELYYAAMALYAATKDNEYLKEAKSLSEFCSLFDFTYDSFAGYGTALYLLLGEESLYKSELLAEYIKMCQGMIDRSNQDGYLTASNRVYQWSGNMHIGNASIALLVAKELVLDDTLLKPVQQQIDYLLGKNALNLSFVTMYGDNQVKNIHNRLTISHQSLIPGFVVAGVDRNYENSILKSSVSKDTAAAKAFVDHNESYSNTEVAIYQNSVLIFMLGAFQ